MKIIEFPNLSMKKVLKIEPLVNIIFDKLNWKDKLNFSLCCKKLYSFFQKRNKILKTNIECNHTHHIKEIGMPILKNILSKYKNIKEIETSFGDNNLKFLVNANLVNLEKEESYHLSILDLSFLSNLNNLEILKISNCTIEGFEPIKGLKELKEFSMLHVETIIKKNFNFDKFDDFGEFDPDYFEGQLYREQTTFDISPISYCFNLEKLALGNIKLISYEPISKLINLKELDFSQISGEID